MILIRLRILGLAALVILAGLVLRLVPWGLPLWAHHVGGGILWGAMLYLAIAAMRPPNWGRAAVIAVAMGVACAVELLRLYRDPALDAFRATLAGQLLLGRIFSAWNILSYGCGIFAAVLATRWIARPPCRQRRADGPVGQDMSSRPLDRARPRADPSHPVRRRPGRWRSWFDAPAP